MNKKVFIYTNRKESSNNACSKLLDILKNRGFETVADIEEGPDFLICIGGDGTFLSFIHKFAFPDVPILGINTGHLGFFQEASPSNLELAIDALESGDYKLQKIKPITAEVHTDKNSYTRIGLNEILVRGLFSHVSQFSVSIDDTKIQDFSGDGLLISTPVGSTAYNYSLDGSLVSPDLDVMQITPVAPMNTNAYRCFHSSILLPAKDIITIEGIGRNTNGTIILSFDGRTHEFNNVKNVTIEQSSQVINLIRFKDYDYWAKLSNKLL